MSRVKRPGFVSPTGLPSDLGQVVSLLCTQVSPSIKTPRSFVKRSEIYK